MCTGDIQVGEDTGSYCLSSKGIVKKEYCPNGSFLEYNASRPGWCKRSYISETIDKEFRLSHPVFYEGRSLVLCLSIEIDNGKIELEGSKELEGLVKDFSKHISEMKIKDPIKILMEFYSFLLQTYHRFLVELDNIVEKIIRGIMEGEERGSSLFDPYRRSVHLHKGMHGLIYALRSLSKLSEVFEPLLTDALNMETMCSSLIDRITEGFSLYYTITGEKTNSFVTKLTIISAVFLPLTLITGIYGMNFKYMPELSHPIAYPLTLIIMALIVLGEIIYFKRKKWI